MLLSSLLLTACGGTSMPPAGAQFEAWHDAGMNPPDAPYGVWNMARKDGTQASFEEQAAALEAIGYLDGSTAAPANTGVRLHLKDKAQQGLNFYTSGHAPAAWLMDMEGKVLHEWRHELKDIWPDYPLRDESPKTGYWRRAHLLPDGSVLAIFEGIGIIKVDKDSKLLWAQQNGAHHDLELQPNGDIWVLTRKAHAVPDIESRFPTLEDFATLMDKDGKEKQSISLLDAARNSGEIGKEMWAYMQPDGDVMHTNSIAVVRGGQSTPGFAEGNLILSMLFVNTVAVLDPAAGKFVWAQREPWKRQHHARILSNRKLMAYDNRSTPNHTALVEMDHSTREVTWEYRGSEEQPFYSYSCGAYHEQPNGNFVIVESDGGRAFEITRDKEKVWEFYNPNQAGEEGQYIATLFDLLRIAPDYLSVPLGQ